MSSGNNNDHSDESISRVIAKSKKIGYFTKLFGKATATTNESVIVEKNGNIIQIVRINDDSKSYLSFSEKLLSIFGKYKLIQKSIDHTPFNISYKFNKNDQYPLVTKDSQKISAFYTLNLQINPKIPVRILQSFSNNKNITIQDIASMLDQKIRSATASSISNINSSTIKSEEFQISFLSNLSERLAKEEDEMSPMKKIGCEIYDWTAPIFGISAQQEKQIEIEDKKHELQIAELEKEIRLLNEPVTTQTPGNNINVGRDFIIKSSTNKNLLIFLGILIVGAVIVVSVLFSNTNQEVNNITDSNNINININDE